MLSNVALSDEILLIRFEMLFGNALMVLGGWFEFAVLFENEFESIFKYGFKTRKCPPQHKDLMEFEDDLQKMISNVQFRRVKNNFQNRLKNDIRSTQSSKKVFVFADKRKNV